MSDLISREALKESLEELKKSPWYVRHRKTIDGIACRQAQKEALQIVENIVDNAPTIKLTESDIQELLRPRCMTVVSNDYLMTLHGGPDRFTLEELRAWLYENAFNNIGTQYEKDVIEIINRLDGFVRFCKDRRGET